MNNNHYCHFGKQADVWKHLPLCEIMINEKPQVYVETNSAFAHYLLSNTPEQRYGIYHFLDKAKGYDNLTNSLYYQLESAAMEENHYLGSPGLALNVLPTKAKKFIFFDKDVEALSNINGYAIQHSLSDKTKTLNCDSRIGLKELLPSLPESTLIHIDPYEIDMPGSNGYTYMDLFVQASNLGMKCYLWYGFRTLEEKRLLNDFIKTELVNCDSSRLLEVELIMKVIEEDTIPCNPGILGSGLLASNLSNESISIISDYSKLLIKLYEGISYNEFIGDLYRDVVVDFRN